MRKYRSVPKRSKSAGRTYRTKRKYGFSSKRGKDKFAKKVKAVMAVVAERMLIRNLTTTIANIQAESASETGIYTWTDNNLVAQGDAATTRHGSSFMMDAYNESQTYRLSWSNSIMNQDTDEPGNHPRRVYLREVWMITKQQSSFTGNSAGAEDVLQNLYHTGTGSAFTLYDLWYSGRRIESGTFTDDTDMWVVLKTRKMVFEHNGQSVYAYNITGDPSAGAAEPVTNKMQGRVVDFTLNTSFKWPKGKLVQYQFGQTASTATLIKSGRLTKIQLWYCPANANVKIDTVRKKSTLKFHDV